MIAHEAQINGYLCLTNSDSAARDTVNIKYIPCMQCPSYVPATCYRGPIFAVHGRQARQHPCYRSEQVVGGTSGGNVDSSRTFPTRIQTDPQPPCSSAYDVLGALVRLGTYDTGCGESLASFVSAGKQI